MTDTQAETQQSHTPGHWRVDPDNATGVQFQGNGRWYDVAQAFSGLRSDSHANARLIAAAPDMLAALQALVQAAPVAWQGGAWGIARAAILRATGAAQ